MNFRKTLFVFLGIFLCSIPSVFAYDDDITHPALTQEVLRFYNLTHPNAKISESDQKLIIEGSNNEDITPRWVNHFYDPMRNEGWTGEHQGDTPALAARAFARVGVISRNPLSAPEWAVNDLAQYDYERYGGDYSWRTGLQAYAIGDRDVAMKALGHTLHLLEDMAMPDHTRNDSHAPLKEVTGDEGSPYEAYAVVWNNNSIKQLQIPEKLIKEKKSTASYATIRDSLHSVAEYSNRYFFSKDTINDPKYENPKVVSVEGNYAYGIDENDNLVKISKIQYRDNKFSELKNLILDKNSQKVFDSYFSRLASKAVLEGAGVIELFLKQGEDQKITNEFAPHILGIDRHAFRTPMFSFIGEAGRAFNTVAELLGTVSDAIVSLIKGEEQKKIENNEIVDLVIDESEITKERTENSDEVLTDEENNEGLAEEQQETQIQSEIQPQQVVFERPIRSEFIATTTEVVRQIISTTTVAATTGTTTTIATSTQTAGNTTTRAASSGGSGGAYVVTDEYPNAKIDIGEIMYNSAGSDAGNEWVEIYNLGTSTATIKNLRFVESGQKHTLSLWRGNDTLLSQEYGIIANSPEKFLENYPSYTGSIWKSAMALSNTHDTLAIFGNVRNLGEAEYFSSYGANGDGNSLQKIENSWYQSTPTPGEKNKYILPHTNQKPIVEFSFTPGEPKERDVVTLSASSTDPDGTIEKFIWKFGDGDEFTSVTSTIEHTYSTVGTYIAEVNVYDNENEYTRTTTTISIEPSGGIKADHIVISEVQYGGIDAGDEFIELYNPSTSTIDMTGWSIQYASGLAEEITPETVSKKNFVASSSIRREGYFLITRGVSASGDDGYSASTTPDLSHRSFSMSSAQTGGLVFLVKNDEKIESVNDIDVVDFVNYKDFDLSNGKSLERRAWNGNMCASAIANGSGEFQGNGCDTELMHSDFEVRDNPTPQNNASMVEPRDAPPPPSKQNGKETYGEYTQNSNIIDFSWSTSTDSEGNDAWYDITLVSSTSTTQIVHTSSTMFSYISPYVGKDYLFQLKACDRDGACSNSLAIPLLVPSYVGDVYFGTRNNESIIELTAERYPFIPDFNDQNHERKLVVYFNKDAELTGQTKEFENLPDTLTLNFPGCHGYESQTKDVVFPGGMGTCLGYGPGSGNYNIRYAEDNVIVLKPVLPDGQTQFLPSDYITFAFYSLDPTASERYFNLITRDATRYYFNSSENKGKNPIAHGPIQSEFTTNKSSITLRWNDSTDPDSRDGGLINEVAISTSTATSSLVWRNIGGSTTTSFITGIEFPVYAHIRTIDTDGNYSEIVSENINLVNPTVILSQTELDNYSYRPGNSPAYITDNDEAEYQNILVHSTTTFDIVGLKTWKHSIYDSGLRLILYSSLPSGLPDFDTVIGKAQIGNYTSIDQGTEVILSFENPITLDPEVLYWFSLDVPGAYRGTDMGWKIATKNTDTPIFGRAGWGMGPGKNETCSGGCTFTEAEQSPHEWWMKIGKK